MIKKYTAKMLDAVYYRHDLFGTTKEDRDLWSKSKKSTLIKQWQGFARHAGIENPLPAEIVINIISSRILLLSETAFCNDHAFDDLFVAIVEEFAKTEPGDEKNYWKAILPGLLALGANPVKVLDDYSAKNKNEDTSKIIHEISQYSEIILTHLQQRAQHMESCTIDLGPKFECLIAAANQFGRALHEATNNPGFLTSLAALFSKNHLDGRNEKAHLFASILQIIYIILNDDLSNEFKTDAPTPLSEARKKYTDYRAICDTILKQTSWYNKQGKHEFNELVNAVDSLDGELKLIAVKRSAKRTNSETEYKAAKMVKEAQDAVEVAKRQTEEAEKKAEAERIEKEAAITEKQAAKRQTEEAEKKAEVEKSARKEADAQLEGAMKREMTMFLQLGLQGLEKPHEIESVRQDICQTVAALYKKSIEEVTRLMSGIIQESPASQAIINRPAAQTGRSRFFATPTAGSNQQEETAATKRIGLGQTKTED